MTINSVDKMWSRTATSESSPDLRSYEVTATEAYQVTHSFDATEAEILSATGVPVIGQAYPGSDYIRCRTRSVEKVGIIFSIVTCEFSGSTGPGGISDGPVSSRPQVTWRSLRSNEQIDVDGYGFSITNTIGEPVDGLSKGIVDFELTVVRNFLFFSTYAQREYLDSVNSDWFGRPGDLWPPGTVALEDFQLEEVDDESVFFHKVTCRFIFRVAYNTIPARAWWHRYRNEGYYMRTGTGVEFTGGGGTGAAAYAVANSDGEITNIVLTARGRGYTSAPTVAITSTTGGSGATATATRNARGEVASVAVTAAGSGYKSRIVRATDGNGQEVVKPVLLKANGFKEENAANAFWVERPKKSYYLPYFSLGML